MKFTLQDIANLDTSDLVEGSTAAFLIKSYISEAKFILAQMDEDTSNKYVVMDKDSFIFVGGSYFANDSMRFSYTPNIKDAQITGKRSAKVTAKLCNNCTYMPLSDALSITSRAFLREIERVGVVQL